MLTQTDGKGQVTIFGYNSRSLAVRKVDNGGSLEETYAYYADGSMRRKTDRNGVLSEYTYDIHGRLTQEVAGESPISYTYDSNGNQLNITDATGVTTRTYDALNRVITKTVPVLGATTFVYDITAGLTSGYTGETTTDPKGNMVTRIYDKAGRLYQVKDGAAVMAAYTYYDNGNLQKMQYNGSSEEYTYYPNNRLHTLANKKGSTIIEAYNYSYDPAGNQTGKLDGKGTTSYSYDPLNRLLSVTEPGGEITSYTYDAAGNRAAETVTAGGVSVTTGYAYDGLNRLVNTEKALADGSTEVVSYTYDNNGNMLSQLHSTIAADAGLTPALGLYQLGVDSPAADAIYEYDTRNQLIKVSQGSHIVECTYNGEGLRVSKTVDGQTLRYLYEYDKIILEINGAGNETAHNVYGTNLVSRTAAGETLYYMYNGHGDVTALLDNAGTIRAGYYYDAFGSVLEHTGMDSNVTYAGYQYDKETGLYYLNSRMYDPGIARFLQEDTCGEDMGTVLVSENSISA